MISIFETVCVWFPKNKLFSSRLFFDAEVCISLKPASLKRTAFFWLIPLPGSIIILSFASCFNSFSNSIPCAAFSWLPEVKIRSTFNSINISKDFLELETQSKAL